MGYAYEQMLVRSVEEATARAEAAEARSAALSDLIAGDADLIDGGK